MLGEDWLKEAGRLVTANIEAAADEGIQNIGGTRIENRVDTCKTQKGK